MINLKQSLINMIKFVPHDLIDEWGRNNESFNMEFNFGGGAADTEMSSRKKRLDEREAKLNKYEEDLNLLKGLLDKREKELDKREKELRRRFPVAYRLDDIEKG